ncbi:MAG: twin-arginine translocation signal domain-containing protein, partial [Planctomycetaceae bacterium]|nr:twin-arginine translocation signal domain-containing protein [Planctomycetaceae bacterium]
MRSSLSRRDFLRRSAAGAAAFAAGPAILNAAVRQQQLHV